MTEEYWQQEKKRKANSSEELNKILKITKKDAEDLAQRKHPKALYHECLKNSSFWHHYSASDKFTVDDMAMLVCKDLGKNIIKQQNIYCTYYL